MFPIPGNSEAVERLLGDGASVDVKDNFGVTPLHYAAESGNLNPLEF